MQYKPISLHYKQKHITMKKQMKQIALPLFLGGLIACSPKTAVNETHLLGNWTEILPPSSNFVQGMTLAKEGKASSIGMATLQYDGQYMLLSQYRTASGYGYKNTILDLRGKGKEATLTRSTDGKTFQLTEKD